MRVNLKRIFVFLMIICLFGALAGCAKKTDDANNSSNDIVNGESINAVENDQTNSQTDTNEQEKQDLTEQQTDEQDKQEVSVPENADINADPVDEQASVIPSEPLPVSDITRFELVNEMYLGWNLGNTLDALGGETNWGNPKTTKEMIDAIKEKGFKTLRVPISWDDSLGASPDFEIKASFLNRVEEIVNYGLANDMYVIINIHHHYGWEIPKYENEEDVTNQLVKIWTQVSDRFKNYDEHLIFETMNEPRLENDPKEWSGGTAEARDVINHYNAAILDTIRNSGGNNEKRFVMIPTYAASSGETETSSLVVPDDDRVIVSLHAYTPYFFAMDTSKEWSVETWGSDADKKELDDMFKRIDKYFISKGIPVVIGEFGSVNKNNLDERIRWVSYYISKARELGITCVWWDNGNATNSGGDTYGIFNRKKLVFTYPGLVEAMLESALPIE